MIKLNVPKVDIEFYFEDKQYNLYKREDIIVIKEKILQDVYYFYYQDDNIYVFKNCINDNNIISNIEKKECLKRMYKVIEISTLMQDVIDKEDIKKLIRQEMFY